MAVNENLDISVRYSFPDESYDTFDDWLAAQQSDDTADERSGLWHGGGEWVLYGLALLYEVRLVIHTVDATKLECVGPAQGTELVDARRTADGPAVHLAALRTEDGTYDHFDVLLFGPSRGAVPLGRASPYSAQSGVVTVPGPLQPPRRAVSARLVAWAALQMIAVALCLGLAPSSVDGQWLRLPHGARQAIFHLAGPPVITLLAGSDGAALPTRPIEVAMPPPSELLLAH